jgi:DNA-binding GntR family transcriptional regulator
MTLKRPKSLRELALDHLRSHIVNGTLKMGQALSERQISAELGVSKSPVREALAQLRDEGLVIIEPQKVARVFSLTAAEVAQICDFRLAIEVAAVELALARNHLALADELDAMVGRMEKAQASRQVAKYLALDGRFHMALFECGENQYLSASYARYASKIAALRTHLSRLPQHTQLSFTEHRKIANAARKNDLTAIRRILLTHIDRTRQTYLAQLDSAAC